MKKLIIRNSHFFENNNRYYLFQGDSLRLFELDRNHYELLQLAYTSDNLSFLEETYLQELESLDILVKEEQYLEELDNLRNTQNDKSLSTIVLCISNDCNLNCKYCFGDGGTYQKERTLMSKEIAKKSIDFFVAHSGNNKFLSIVFFGGEPLLNFPVMEFVINYCHAIEATHEKVFKFSISTNGTIMNDEIIHCLTENNVGITLSIDGPKDINDSYRCYASGGGSFEKVTHNVQRLINAPVAMLNARATICNWQPDVSYIENGLRPLGFNSIHMTLVDADDHSPLLVDDQNIQQVIDGYAKLARNYIADVKTNTPNRSKVFDEILFSLYRKHMKLRSCNLAISSMAIDYKGNCYPCHRFMGNDKFLLGNIINNIETKNLKPFQSLNVLNITKCNNCWARFLCGGSCAHSRVKHTQSLYIAFDRYCIITKKFYEMALYVYSELKNYDPNIFNSLFMSKES